MHQRHFTYATRKEIKQAPDLFQGDIILPPKTARKRDAIPFPAGVLGYVVTSQTCDLVEYRLKAIPICLSPLFPADEVMQDLTKDFEELWPGFINLKEKRKYRNLMERVYNQNETSKGLFYLQADAYVGLGQNAIAKLRYGVQIETGSYTELKRLRRGRLSAEFRAQLGWMVGNLYSRPATSDWKKELMKEMLDEASERSMYLSKRELRRIRTEMGAGGIDQAAIAERLAAIRQEKSVPMVLRAVAEAVSERLRRGEALGEEELYKALYMNKKVRAAIEEAEIRGIESTYL